MPQQLTPPSVNFNNIFSSRSSFHAITAPLENRDHKPTWKTINEREKQERRKKSFFVARPTAERWNNIDCCEHNFFQFFHFSLSIFLLLLEKTLKNIDSRIAMIAAVEESFFFCSVRFFQVVAPQSPVDDDRDWSRCAACRVKLRWRLSI